MSASDGKGSLAKYLGHDLTPTWEHVIQEVAKELLDDLPGAGSIVRAGKTYLQVRDTRLVLQFVRDLADLMGKESPEKARQYLAQQLEHEWAQEGVARGLRAILDAVDDDARRCIAALVANYFSREAPPNLSHKRIASLLVDSDAQTLSLLLAVLEVYPLEAPEDRYLGLIAGSAEGYAGKVWFAPSRPKEIPPEQTASVPGQLCDEVGALLINHGLATVHGGFSSSTLGDESALVPRSMGPAVVLLRDCLRAAGIEARSNDA